MLLNHQEVFNTVMTHAKKKEPSKHKDGSCYYRGPGYTKCFVGALIPDEVYDPEMEGGLRNLVKNFPDAFGGPVDQEDIDFLKELQKVHDDYGPLDWYSRLVAVALSHGLNPF